MCFYQVIYIDRAITRSSVNVFLTSAAKGNTGDVIRIIQIIICKELREHGKKYLELIPQT